MSPDVKVELRGEYLAAWHFPLPPRVGDVLHHPELGRLVVDHISFDLSRHNALASVHVIEEVFLTIP